MALLHWQVQQLPWRLKKWFRLKKEWMRLLRMTLCYNYFTNCSYALETILEPAFCFVDRFAKYLGPIFVTVVVFLTTSVVIVFYVCLLPDAYEHSPYRCMVHAVIANWLLVNVAFNYLMGVFTSPGLPPQTVEEVVSICKKCISPKPPRTHHCTVCGKCILKMDHHCPWLNNCVGFHNHRYFLLFVWYMCIGSFYVSWVGYDQFKHHFYGEKEYPFPGALFPLNMIHEVIYNPKQNNAMYSLEKNKSDFNERMDLDIDYKEELFHNAVVCEFIVCTGVTLALALLGMWHVWLISVGETSIEVHINKREKKRLRKNSLVFANPYDFGIKKNWQIFLGLTHGRSFWRHVLLPSRYKPDGNGLKWTKATYTFNKDTGLQLL